MKKSYQLLSLLLALLIFSTKSFAQNNLAAGDLAIVSYQSDFDPTNPIAGDNNLAEFEDRFSLVITKQGGIAAGTVIFFTTRGWNGPVNTWHDEDFTPFTFGLGRRAVVQWTAPAGGIAQGTEVFFINRYHDEVPVGSEYYDWAAYANEAGTILINNLTNVTPIVPAANSTDGMSFAVSGDKLLVYQTGPVAGPNAGPNSATIRFITALLANNNGTTVVVGTTTYANWDAVPGAMATNESSVPPGLVNGQTCFLMSPSILPAVSNGTTEPDNGKFSACALSAAGVCTALQMSAIIYATNPAGPVPTTPNWTYSNAVFPLGTSSSLCTYTILPTNTITLTSAAGTNNQTRCINTAITNITYSTTGATGATFSGLPAGVTGAWAANVVTISGSPTTTVGSPFNYTVTLTGGCGVVTATGTITVTPNNTITLTSAAGTNAQTVCINTPITNITYSTTGATGATFSGLPTGVTGAWAANVVTISGSPTTTVGSPFSYTITLTGGCGVITATGTITVNGVNTITLTSAAGTNNQTVLVNTPITNITYSTTNATGATFSGLPAGVTGSWAANVVTISGSPTTVVGSPFSYTVTLTGGCGVTTATGTITVTTCTAVDQTVSASPTAVCSGGSSTITVGASQPGVNYTLRIDPANTFVAGPTASNGPAINFSTGPIAATTTYNVLAETDKYSINLNGSQSGFAIPQAAPLDVTNNFTIEGWIKPAGNGSFARLYNKDGSHALGVSAGQTQLTFTRHTSGDFSRPFTFINGTWYHIACTYVSGTVELFVNGASIGTVAGVPPIAVQTFGGHIGSDAGGAFNQFNGNIDNVRIWNSVRTPAQIAANQAAFLTSTGNPTLVASWWIIEGAGNARDYTTNAIHATALAGIWQVDAPVAPCTIVLTNKPTVTINASPSASVISAVAGPLTLINEGFNVVSPLPAGWAQQNLSTPVGITPLWFQGNSSVFSAQSGAITSYIAANFNGVAGNNTISNWLFTPNITLTNGDIFTFWSRTVDASSFPDRLEVRMSTNGASVNAGVTNVSVGDFTTLLLTINPGLTPAGYPNVWTQYTITISGLGAPTSGRMAFRYFVTNGGPSGTNSDYIGVDNVVYTASSSSSAICLGSTANIKVDITGGTSPYTIVYNANPPGGPGGNVTVNNYVSGTSIPVTPSTTTDYTLVSVTSANSCPGSGNSGTATITVNPNPTVNAVGNQVVCNNTSTAAVNFSGTPPGVVFNWTNNTPSIGLAGSGTGNITAFTATNTGTAPVVATITVTPSYTNAGVTCTGTPTAFTYTVNPTATVNAVTNQTVCNGASTTAINFSSPTTGGTIVYNWTNNTPSIGLAASGSGNIATFTAINATAVPVTATITVTPSYTNAGTTCTGTPATFTITVNPTNTITLTSAPGTDNQTVLVNTAITNITYSTTAATGATFSGLPAGVIGNWAGNVVTISGTPTAVGTFNYTVTLTGGCGTITATGTITVFNCSITLTSAPGTDAQTVCNNTPITNITYSTTGATGASFAGLPAGVTGNWAANVATISGTPSAAGTFNYTVTLTGGGCGAFSASGTITVNPIPDVNQPANQVVCNGAPTAPVNFTGSVAGTIYNWTNNTTSIGLAASGTGNIASFTAINATNAPVVATVTVTPSTTGGSGANTFNFTTCGASGIAGPSQAQANTAYAATPLAGQVTIVGSGVQQWVVPTTGIYTITAGGASGGYTPLAIGGRGRVITTQVNLTAGNVINILVGQEGGRAAFSTPGYSGGGGGGSFIINQTTNTAILISGGGGGAGQGNATYGSPVINGVDASEYNVTNGGDGLGSASSWSVIGIGGNGGAGGTAPGFGGAGGAGYSGNGQAPNSGAGEYGGNPGISYSNGGLGGINRNWAGGTTSNIPGGFGGGAGAGTHTNYEANGGGAGGYSGGGGSNSRVGAGGGAGNLFTGTFMSSGLNSGNGYVTISASGITCTGTPKTFTITVNPTPNAVATPASQTICSGSAITTIALTGNVSATVYNWIRDNTGTGIANSGAGNISGTLTNTTNAPVTVTFTITPSYTNAGTTCTGTPITATVVVNPIPNAVATPASQTMCSGNSITTIALTGNVSGTVYNWVRDNTVSVTGIAASGSGDISGILTNTTNAPVTVTFTITPSYTNGGTTCTGTPITATVVVNPIPNAVATPASQTICSGASITTIVLTGNVSGTVYNWTRNNPGVTGIPNSGSGNISGTLTNTTNAPVTVTFTITPSYTNGGTTCTGSSITATVLVNPTPNAVATPASQTICSGNGIATIVLTGNVTGTVFNWVRDNPGVTGIANSGTGNISGTLTNTTNAPITVTFTITPIANGCPGAPITATVLVNPTATINAVPNQVLCNGSPSAPVNFTSPTMGGTIVYNWTNNTPAIGLVASGTGNIASFTATNPANGPLVATITVTPTYTNGGVSCVGTPITFTITVNPTATIDPVANRVLCNGATSTAINFTSPTTGGTIVYTWTNSQPSIGLAASGSGNIPSFVAINLTNAPVVATITVTPTYTNGGVSCVGTPMSFTITVNPPPTINPVPNQVVCNNAATAPVIFTTPTTGGTAVYNWTNNNTSIGLAASGTGNIPSFIGINATNGPNVATITITMIYTSGGISCVSLPVSFTITVNPTPIVNQVANQVICNGSPTVAVNFSSPTTGGTIVYNWTNPGPFIGLGSNGTGNIPSFIATNSGTTPVTATIMVIATYTSGGISCTGPAMTFTITVNPTPTVNTVANQVLCNGSNTAPVNFTGTVAGTIYNWTNNNTGIGLAASGTGNIASFTAINTSNIVEVATVIVTPTYTNGGVSCSGTPYSFTITVNPTPTINAVANQTVCAAATVTVNFTGTVAGTVYNWTNSNTAIGLGATGAGNLNFTATNTSGAPITGSITVTPTYSNAGVTCTGTPVSFTITVNPTPIVNQVASQVLCTGSPTIAIIFTGSAAGTVYNWMNNTTTIGLGATGTGNIASFTSTNVTTAPVVATITVTPSFTAGGVTCTGPAMSFTITVNPLPSVNTVSNQVLCNGATTSAVAFSGPVAGTVYSWTNNNTSIGLGAAGTNNIPAFIATNNTNSPVVAMITVTPSYTNGGVTCSGASTSFTITVNPTPTVNAVANQALCNGSPTATITFSGVVTGTVYSWTNSNTAIGLAASGTGNIASFTATNTTTAPITATIMVTPSGAGCTGTSVSFTITVNPTPTVNQPPSQPICAGSTTTPIIFTGSIPGTVYTWTNNNTSIGLGASGTGDIPAFVAINTGNGAVVATITVTPSFNNGGVICTGASRNFNIIVTPQPNIVFNGVPPRVCLTDTLVNLRAIPAGGTWSGRGVSGSTFSATAAGQGVHTLSYTVTNASGCTGTSYVNVTVNDCIERHNIFQTAIRIWPNPNNGKFSIQFNSDQYKEFKVKVVSTRGQELGNYEFKNLVYGSMIPMDLSRLPGGTYFLYVYNTQESGVFQIVIAR